MIIRNTDVHHWPKVSHVTIIKTAAPKVHHPTL